MPIFQELDDIILEARNVHKDLSDEHKTNEHEVILDKDSRRPSANLVLKAYVFSSNMAYLYDIRTYPIS